MPYPELFVIHAHHSNGQRAYKIWNLPTQSVTKIWKAMQNAELIELRFDVLSDTK